MNSEQKQRKIHFLTQRIRVSNTSNGWKNDLTSYKGDKMRWSTVLAISVVLTICNCREIEIVIQSETMADITVCECASGYLLAQLGWRGDDDTLHVERGTEMCAEWYDGRQKTARETARDELVWVLR